MMPMLLLEDKQSASNRTPRQINRNLIFNQIRTRQPISRADLARTSGLQRSTVSLIVEELLRERAHPKEILRRKKPTFARPAPEDLRQEILKQSDAVIEALAD